MMNDDWIGPVQNCVIHQSQSLSVGKEFSGEGLSDRCVLGMLAALRYQRCWVYVLTSEWEAATRGMFRHNTYVHACNK